MIALRFYVSSACSDWGDLQEIVPAELSLFNAYPNPFNATATIEFSLPQQSQVSLDVFNLLGARVTTLVNGKLTAGMHRVNFDGGNFASGVYVYRLDAGDYSEAKKVVLMK